MQPTIVKIHRPYDAKRPATKTRALVMSEIAEYMEVR